jgi:ribose transport system permease protein
MPKLFQASWLSEAGKKFFRFDLAKPHHRFSLFAFVTLVSVLVIYNLLVRGELSAFSIAYATYRGLPIIIMALGAGLVIATGQIDLSCGAIAALSSVVFAYFASWGPYYVYVGIILSIALGSLTGVLNGKFVSRCGAALIVTWALGECYYFMAVVLTTSATHGSLQISLRGDLNFKGFDFSQDGFRAFWLVLGACIIGLSWSRLVENAMAVGADARAALYLGINTEAVREHTFVVSGILSAIAGILSVYSYEGSNLDFFPQNVIHVVAICVLAGVLLSGGHYSIISIVVAGTVWVVLEQVLKPIKIPWLSSNVESLVNKGIFPLIVLISALLAGQRLAGQFRSRLVAMKGRE